MKIRLLILGVIFGCGVVMAAFASVMTLVTLLAVDLIMTHITTDRGVASVIYGSAIAYALLFVNIYLLRNKIRNIIKQSQ